MPVADEPGTEIPSIENQGPPLLCIKTFDDGKTTGLTTNHVHLRGVRLTREDERTKIFTPNKAWKFDTGCVASILHVVSRILFVKYLVFLAERV